MYFQIGTFPCSGYEVGFSLGRASYLVNGIQAHRSKCA